MHIEGGVWLTILAWVGIVAGILTMLAGVIASLVGLPGSVAVLIVAFTLSACTHWQRPPWWVVLIFLGVTAFAETADNLLSAWGVRRYGGSTRGSIWALVGGIAGAILGGQIGIVVGGLAGPLGATVGAILMPLVLGFAGGFAGGYCYERRQGRPQKEAAQAGWGAFLGRAAGALIRGVLAALMAGTTIWLLFRKGGPFG
ncbi:MAG: DUF456 family protein [Candidatus Zipacnadales bacterium]